MRHQKNILKILRTFFAEPFVVDDITYQFVDIDVEKDFSDAFKFKVNVILPEPNQSYFVEVFDEIIQNIITDSFNFIGETYSYSLNIEVNGQELFPETYVYIRKESLSNIMNEVNKKFDRIGISSDFGGVEKNLKMNCRASWDRIPYGEQNENINFYIKLELSDFELNGRYVIPNPDKRNVVAGTLYNILVDRDWFVPIIEDIVYREISPETKISTTDDVYAQVIIRINRLSGELVKQMDNFYKFRIDDFIEVS